MEFKGGVKVERYGEMHLTAPPATTGVAVVTRGGDDLYVKISNAEFNESEAPPKRGAVEKRRDEAPA